MTRPVTTIDADALEQRVLARARAVRGALTHLPTITKESIMKATTRHLSETARRGFDRTSRMAGQGGAAALETGRKHWAPLALIAGGLGWIIAREVMAGRRSPAERDAYDDLNAHDDAYDSDGLDMDPAVAAAENDAEAILSDPWPRDPLMDDPLVAGGFDNTPDAEEPGRLDTMKDTVARKNGRMRKWVGRKTRAARDHARATGHSMSEGTTEAARAARIRALRARDAADRAGRSALRTSRTALTEHPLLAGGLFVLAGAAVALSLPASRRERELIGEQARLLRRRALAEANRARAAAEAGLKQARHAAEDAVSEGVDSTTAAARAAFEEARSTSAHH